MNAILKITLFSLLIASFSSCDVLEQLAKQGQNQGKGNPQQGKDIQLEGTVLCQSEKRYVDPVFPKSKIKIFKDIPFATMTKEEQWNNGNNSLCFGDRDYKFPTADGLEELRMDLYIPNPNVDECRDKPLILFFYNGGFSPFGTFSKSVPLIVESSTYLAQLGYAVAAVDYRKGFDFVNNTYHPDALADIPIMRNIDCKESSTPDPNSFQITLFRFIQDIRAAHRFLHANNDLIGTDNDKIFYLGASTGAIGSTHAAFAYDDMQHWSKYTNLKMNDFGNHRELESEIKIAGVLNAQSAIHDLSWVEASDNIPIFMMHGEADIDVPFEQGSLAGIKTFNGSAKNAQPFKLHGSKDIYDKIATFNNTGGTNGKLVAFDGITHNLAPIMTGQCAKLKGSGLQGEIWREAYAFAKAICTAKDNETSYQFNHTYCLYQRPTSINCNAVCN